MSIISIDLSGLGSTVTIILGIDPGSRKTGYGIIKTDGRRCYYLASGCINLKSETLAARLGQIFSAISQLILQYQPQEAAIEQVFMAKNASAAFKLGQARGAAMVALANQALTVAEYSARQVKQTVVGYGAADKAQIQHMVKTILQLSGTPQVDAADALAIAMCHAQYRQSYQAKLAAVIAGEAA